MTRKIPGRPDGVTGDNQVEYAVAVVLCADDWSWDPYTETLIHGDGGISIEDPLAKAFLDYMEQEGDPRR